MNLILLNKQTALKIEKSKSTVFNIALSGFLPKSPNQDSQILSQNEASDMIIQLGGHVDKTKHYDKVFLFILFHFFILLLELHSFGDPKCTEV